MMDEFNLNEFLKINLREKMTLLIFFSMNLEFTEFLL